jgi:NTE family protein
MDERRFPKALPSRRSLLNERIASAARKGAPTRFAAIARRYDRVALVLQGGGALGAYQIGVYQALAEAGCEPNWISGVSIGAINSAIIAGNGPEKRLQNLEAFWSRSPGVRFGPICRKAIFFVIFAIRQAR